MKSLGIGSTIWWYGKTPMTIIGETSRSWIVGSKWDSRKVPKRGAVDWQFTEAERDEYLEKAFWRERSWHIGNYVGRCSDPAILRQVAELVGWKEPERKS